MTIIRQVFWIAAIVLIAAVFMLVFHLSATSQEFSQYNTGWNGTSSFFSDLDRHRTTDIYEPGNLAGRPVNSTLLIIAPDRHPTGQQIAAYREFLDNGSVIVIADDFGTGNEILAGISSHIVILPGNLSSLDRRYSHPYSVVAYRSSEAGTLSLPTSAGLNRPAALEGGSPLMLSSIMSWIDANGDRRLNTLEDMGTFSVMAYETMGKGQVIVISDPSILVNTVYSQSENRDDRDLVQAVISGDGPLLIDRMNSRTTAASGMSEILHVIRTTISIEILVLCILMLALAGAWRKRIL